MKLIVQIIMKNLITRDVDRSGIKEDKSEKLKDKV